MDGDVIRIGRVSSVEGLKIRVTYPDRDDAVTEPLPLLGNGVYRVPDVGDLVAVVHFSNGTTAGICLGSLADGGKDYLLAALLARLAAVELRLSVAETTIVNHESRIAALEARI